MSKIKNGIIKIKLISDMCPSSGLGTANIIDTEVSMDRNGLPIIQARRIKGIMRENAEILCNVGLITPNEIEDIFGVPGSLKGELIIDNAVVEGTEGKEDIIYNAIANNKIDKKVILNNYTYVRTSTAVENGVSKEGSLRNMTVIKAGNVFNAKVQIDEKYFEDLQLIVKSITRIGMNKSRGLGEVDCELSECNEDKQTIKLSEFKNEEDVVLSILFKNTSDLIINTLEERKNIEFLPGNIILGALASNYLSQHKYDENFDKLFLLNNVIYNNFYLSNKEGKEFLPTALSIVKQKDTSNIFNKAICNLEKNVIVSPLENTFSNIKKDSIEIISAQFNNNYHTKLKNGIVEDGMFRNVRSLAQGQYFLGTIVGQYQYIRQILEILNNTKLRLGYSKNTQYGNIEILKCDLKVKEQKNIKAKNISVLLASDVVLMDGNGNSTLDLEKLKLAILSKIGVSEAKSRFFINNDILTGYNAKWKMQRPAQNCFKKGSCVVLNLDKENDLKEEYYLGEHNNEGLGRILVFNLDEMSKNLKEVEEETNKEDIKLSQIPVLAESFAKKKLYESVKKLAQTDAENYKNRCYNPVISHVRLLLKECNNSQQVLEELKKIKNNVKRRNALDIFKIKPQDDSLKKFNKYDNYTYLDDEITIKCKEEIAQCKKYNIKYDLDDLVMKYCGYIVDSIKYLQRTQKNVNKSKNMEGKYDK